MLRGLLVLMVVVGVAAICMLSTKDERWAAVYASNASVESLLRFNVLVFDSDHHPQLEPYKNQQKTVLGYLSLGEADPNRDFYYVFEQDNLLLPDAPALQGRKVIDVRKPAWENYVIHTLVPSILRKGFDGLMIDTLDNVTELENADPVKYAGMRASAAKLVRDIRRHYPHITIMVNRGFAVLPAIASSIDIELAESIYSVPEPGTHKFVAAPKQVYQHYTSLLKNAQRQSAALKVYTLDYWSPEDASGIERIYAVQRNSGFIPYVSTQDLQSVRNEP